MGFSTVHFIKQDLKKSHPAPTYINEEKRKPVIFTGFL
jgi:hypothetical protein